MDKTTKDGIEVKPGQVWRDLDKKWNGERYCAVQEVGEGKAVMRACSKEGKLLHGDGVKNSRVSISRMHVCSKGWQLVTD